MNKNIKKIAAIAAGAAILTAVVMPILMPEQAAAAVRWISLKPTISTEEQVQVQVKDNANNEEVPIPADEEVTDGVVVVTKEGEAQRIIIEDEESEKTVPVAVDKDLVEKLQQDVDNGQKTWLLDPVEVVRKNADKYGFNAEADSVTLVSQLTQTTSAGKAKVLVGHGSKYYLVELIQQTGSSHSKIWQVVSVKEVRTTVTHVPQKPDVGPGVEGLDYDKVIKWQQNVDAGRELWRLDPMQVVKIEGKKYGFTEQDTFTVVKRLSSSTISRHGEIDFEVIHQGKKYKMILVKPFGGRDAIWTTYKTYELDSRPERPAKTRVLFETSQYKDWKFYNSQYPQDMFFATIINYDGQVYHDDRVSETIVDKFKGSEFSNKLVLFANLGTSSAKSDIGIEKVTVRGNDMTVYVHTKSPRPDEIITMNIIYPDDYVTIDSNIINKLGRVNITFIDQNGKVLSKNKLTIKK